MTKNIYKKIKNYWNERPCNIRHSKKKLFSREYFQEVKKKDILLKDILESLLNLKNIKTKMC